MAATLKDALRRAREGDIDAYEEVVRQTASAVRAQLALHVRDAETVNDLAQETFLHAYEHLTEFVPGTDFRAWIRTIARTRALRLWRERQRKEAAHRRYVLALQDRLAERAAAAEDPAEGLLAKVKGCLGRLGEHARALLRLRYFENRPLREIAAREGTSPGHVSVTLFRLRRQLAQCLEQGAP